MKALIIEDEIKYSGYFKDGLESTSLFDIIEIAEISDILKKEFASFLNNYSDIDFFVIDINLSNVVGCNLGILFLKHLLSIKENCKYLIVSEWNLKDIKDSDIVNPNRFINKRDFKLGYFLSIAIELKTKEIWGR